MGGSIVSTVEATKSALVKHGHPAEQSASNLLSARMLKERVSSPSFADKDGNQFVSNAANEGMSGFRVHN